MLMFLSLAFTSCDRDNTILESPEVEASMERAELAPGFDLLLKSDCIGEATNPYYSDLNLSARGTYYLEFDFVKPYVPGPPTPPVFVDVLVRLEFPSGVYYFTKTFMDFETTVLIEIPISDTSGSHEQGEFQFRILGCDSSWTDTAKIN